MDYTKIQSLLDKYKNRLDDYKNKKIERDTDNANIFSSISETYKKENYNSDILRFILDPKAMGEEKYLHEFLNIIKIDYNKEEFISDIEVLREKYRVDVLIRNNRLRKAIIIESKINGADDQPMQLIRYYKKLNDDEFDVLKIVYLTIYPKQPKLYYEENKEISKYDFEILKKEINRKIFKTFISPGKTTKEYYKFQDFLEKFSESDIMQQYKKHIDKLGGCILDEEKQIINEIFNDEEKTSEVKNLMNLWEKKAETLCTIFNEKFELNDDEKNWEKDENFIFYSKKYVIQKVKLFYCATISESNTLQIQIGFFKSKI